MKHLGNEPATFWFVGKGNKTAVIFPSPHQFVTHQPHIRQ
jgi:hypothetical protein